MFMKWNADGSAELNLPRFIAEERSHRTDEKLAAKPITPRSGAGLCVLHGAKVLQAVRGQSADGAILDYRCLAGFGWRPLQMALREAYDIRRFQLALRGTATPRVVRTVLRRGHWQLIEAARRRYCWKLRDAAEDWIQQRLRDAFTGHPRWGTLALLADADRYAKVLGQLRQKSEMRLILLTVGNVSALTELACSLNAEVLDLRDLPGVMPPAVTLSSESRLGSETPHALAL